MQRTINHTGRKRITRSNVQIRIDDSKNSAPIIDATLSLGETDLPADSKVYVEAYYRNSLQRFEFGTVGNVVPPRDRQLDQLDLSGPTLFRVRVVDESEHIGRLLATADALRPFDDDDSDGKISLLPVRVRNLGQLPWRVNFISGKMPELCLNDIDRGSMRRIKEDPVYQALILPAAVREILMHYLWTGYDPDDDEYSRRWFDFAEKVHREKPQDEDVTVLMQWVDEVVEEFTKAFGFMDRLVHLFKGAET